MTKIISLSYRLLELTRELDSVLASGMLEELEQLQNARAIAVAEIDSESQKQQSEDDLHECHLILREVQQLEETIVNQLHTFRNQISVARDEINLSKKALQIYDRFQ